MGVVDVSSATPSSRSANATNFTKPASPVLRKRPPESVAAYTIDDDGSNASLRTRSLISPMVIHVAPPSALRYILVPPFSAMPAKTVPACDGSLKTAVAVPPRTATQLPPPSGDRQSAR